MIRWWVLLGVAVGLGCTFDATGRGRASAGEEGTSDGSGPGTGSATSGETEATSAGSGDATSRGSSTGRDGSTGSGAETAEPGSTSTADDGGSSTGDVSCEASDEVCDGVDNDCDGKVDEHSVANLACGGCTSVDNGGIAYYLCPDAVVWADAQTHCESFGADLASIHADAETTFVVGAANSAGIGEAWIGLNDLAQEGTYVWTDGTATDYLNWRVDNPDNYQNNEHCIEKETDGTWNDLPCDRLNPFVCKDPSP